MAEANEAPAEQTDAQMSETNQPTDTEQTQAQEQKDQPIDLGLTKEQAERFQKFMSSNGGFDAAFKKLKTDVSTPTEPTKPAEEQTQASEPQQKENPTSQQTQQPAGSLSQQAFLQFQYLKSIASEEKYAPIAKDLSNGSLLKEMGAFGIQPMNPDGSINDDKVRMYLDLKVQTVPAKPTETEPNANSAPTVDFIEVGDEIKDIDQAYKVLMQANHPKAKLAEEFIANHLNPDRAKNKK